MYVLIMAFTAPFRKEAHDLEHLLQIHSSELSRIRTSSTGDPVRSTSPSPFFSV